MRVLFATDGSRSAEAALERLPVLLGPGIGQLSVVLVAVSSGRGEGAARAIAGLARSKEILGRIGIVPKSIWRVGQDPAKVILDVAASESADLLVVGSRAKSRSGAPLGEVPRQLLERSSVPVLLVRQQAAAQVR